MFKIYLLDRSAESRAALFEQMQRLITTDLGINEVVPHISLKPVSLSEIKFLATPDLCLIGPELVSADPMQVVEVRACLTTSALAVYLPDQNRSLGMIEQLARLGIDDFVQAEISAAEFLRKVVLLCRKKATARSGKLLVVDSAKGGVGVTSIAAAIGESLAAAGRKVLLIDFDVDTQDLSRFLQVRTYLNENFQLILERQRAVTHELVAQCCFKVWSDSELYCMTPMPDSEQLYDSRSGYSRTLLSILEVLDTEFEHVVVDMAALRGLMARTLYHAADKLVFVLDGDPASLYASVYKLNSIRSCTPALQPVLIENFCGRGGLPSTLMREEFNRAARLAPNCWATAPIPFCKFGRKWPGSGSSMYTQGNKSIRRATDSLLEELELASPCPSSKSAQSSMWDLVRSSMRQGAARVIGAAQTKQIKLLPASQAPQLSKLGQVVTQNTEATTTEIRAADIEQRSKLDASQFVSAARIQ